MVCECNQKRLKKNKKNPISYCPDCRHHTCETFPHPCKYKKCFQAEGICREFYAKVDVILKKWEESKAAANSSSKMEPRA